jgi:ATP-dependent Clp protease protease subunit
MSNSERTTLKKFDDFNASDRIDAKLLENSVFYLSGEISEENVTECIRWLIYENLQSSNEKLLTIYINSYGGDLYQAFALIDVIKNSRHPVRTIGVGAIMSAAFLIFISGFPGHRIISKNTSLMCHQFSDEIAGKHHDLKATLKEGENCNTKMLEILKESTGLTAAKIRAKLLKETDVYLTAQEAIELNVADHTL